MVILSLVHDELITAEEIVKSGMMTKEDWEYCHDIALKLFGFGQVIAKDHGFLLVDTKYEFGKDADGTIPIPPSPFRTCLFPSTLV